MIGRSIKFLTTGLFSITLLSSCATEVAVNQAAPILSCKYIEGLDNTPTKREQFQRIYDQSLKQSSQPRDIVLYAEGIFTCPCSGRLYIDGGSGGSSIGGGSGGSSIGGGSGGSSIGGGSGASSIGGGSGGSSIGGGSGDSSIGGGITPLKCQARKGSFTYNLITPGSSAVSVFDGATFHDLNF